jgi:hypothetical protein
VAAVEQMQDPIHGDVQQRHFPPETLAVGLIGLNKLSLHQLLAEQ